MNDRQLLDELKLDTKDALILKKLFDIEKRLEQKIAYLLVEHAVELFRRYLREKKKPEGYQYVLNTFLERFRGQNIAEITAEDMEGFMTGLWGHSKDNTIRVRHAQLNGLFNHANLILKKKGSPVFHNPMALITQPTYEYADITFMPPEQISKIINSVNLVHHWLAMAILASTGIRPGELLKLTVKDIDGQVLTLRNPKSGNKDEWAVIPMTVCAKLYDYIITSDLKSDDRIIPISYNKLNEKVVQKYSEKAGTLIRPHYFRKWAATFWRRQDDPDMVNIILRHKTDSDKDSKLRKIYIASLSKEEVIERVKQIDEVLFQPEQHE